MRVKNAVLFLNEEDIKEVLNFAIKSEGILINEIKFKREEIEVKGNVKKVFTLDFTCSASIIKVKKEEILIKINDVKALKINLFSVIEKVLTKKSGNISLGRYIKIDKNIININLDIVKCKIKNIDFELETLEIVRDGIEIKFDYIDVNFLSMLNASKKKKQEAMVN
ncbi:MAG: hypothetical protein ACRCWG_17900 [Sarcina sp.]